MTAAGLAEIVETRHLAIEDLAVARRPLSTAPSPTSAGSTASRTCPAVARDLADLLRPGARAPALRDGTARPLGVGGVPAPRRAGEGLPPAAARRRPLARRHRPLSVPGGPAARLRPRLSPAALERRERAAAAHRMGRPGRRAIRACSPRSPAGSAGWRPCRRSPGSPTTTCWSWSGDDRAGRAAARRAGRRRPACCRRTDPIARLPILILYPHSRCNCRCLMCDIWRDTRRERADGGRRRALARRAGGRWASSGWCSPAARRCSTPISGSSAPSCASAGIGITLLTTGLLLAPRRRRRWPASATTWWSASTARREVHDRIRNLPRAYAKLAEGVAALRAAGPRIAVSGRCTVQRANFRDLRATVARRPRARARPPQLPRRRRQQRGVQPSGRLGGGAGGRGRPGAGGPPAPRRRARRPWRASTPPTSRAASSPRARRSSSAACSATSPRCSGQGDFAPVECNAPWVSAVVEADGTVRPCFFQPPLGNLREAESLAAILNSRSALAWRRGLDTARDAICRRCVCSLALREKTA